MRRKIDNRSVILIILIASFTLLSYVFDQLVIRNEDKLRTQDIKYQNLFTERKCLESLSTQIMNYSYDIFMQSTDKLENLDIGTTSKYIGGMKQEKLDEAEDADIIFSTYSMSSEAFNLFLNQPYGLESLLVSGRLKSEKFDGLLKN